MKTDSTLLMNRQGQDQELRLQQAALRRAGDEARRQLPIHNRWIAPDTAHLLSHILANQDNENPHRDIPIPAEQPQKEKERTGAFSL